MENIFSQVTRRLIETKQTITFMESCTSGLLASLLTDTEGASAIFKGSLVTYSNEQKIQAGVDPEIIKTFGVYSKETARAMAQTAQTKYQSQIAIGITGTTGNLDPSNSDSQQGKVYFCIISGDKIYDCQQTIDVTNLNRQQIKKKYASLVYTKLAEILVK